MQLLQMWGWSYHAACTSLYKTALSLEILQEFAMSQIQAQNN